MNELEKDIMYLLDKMDEYAEKGEVQERIVSLGVSIVLFLIIGYISYLILHFLLRVY